MEEITFDNAYDVSRSHEFPAGEGSKLTVDAFSKPYTDVKGSSGYEIPYETSAGSWTLERVGTYSYFKTSHATTPRELTYIVNTVAAKYSTSSKAINPEAIMIHELKENNKHIAYGIVIAFSPTDPSVFFLGGLWNSGGAGYFLCTDAHTSADSVEVTATEIATGYVDMTTHVISLDQTETHTFDAGVEGEYIPTPKTVTVESTGTG